MKDIVMDQTAGPAPQAAVPAVPRAGQAQGSSSDRIPVLAWLIAAAFVAVELAVSGRYGFMQDELYFVEASRHLAFGYVDQPPLTPLLTRVAELPGLSPTAIRIIPALAGGAVVVAAARFAALFGAGRLGRVLAALTMACTPVLLGSDHVDNTTAPDLLVWTVVLLCVSTALLRDRPRWWLGAGVAAGLGLENNNLMLMLLIAVGLGVLLSPQAGVLRTRWPWLGAAIAAVIWVPNLIWQATHGWPQLAMASALRQQNDSPGNYLGGLPAAPIFRQLPPAHHLPRPVPGPKRLDPHPNRHLHWAFGQLAHTLASAEALPVTQAGNAAGTPLDHSPGMLRDTPERGHGSDEFLVSGSSYGQDVRSG